VKVTESYWSLGGAYMPKLGPNGTLGLHLEGRGETMSLQGQAKVNGVIWPQSISVTFLRPWARVSADYTFSHVGATIHPYLGVDASVALTRTSQTMVPDYTNMDNRTVQSMAPRYSYAAYAGLRF
jgi:hypothetical protein